MKGSSELGLCNEVDDIGSDRPQLMNKCLA